MSLEFQPTEIVINVFMNCPDVQTVLALALTCKRFKNIYNSSRKLPILEHAAEAQYGPLTDAIQLLTHNASQPAHLIRTVPFSVALVKQIVHIGSIAEKWCDIYPFKKWKHNYEDRRLLTSDERYKFRRGLYRLWLYSRAFYNARHTRTARMHLPVLRERAELLHNWTTAELAEMADVHIVLREVVHGNVCPSNGTIARKFKKRHPVHGDHQLLFNIHLNYPPPPMPPFMSTSPHHNPTVPVNHFAYSGSNTRNSKYTPTPFHEVGAEGWGDDIGHYYVVEDMMKLDPEQILWLKENAPLKGQVEGYVRGLGDWFENNGETWSQTLQWVLGQRGDDRGELEDNVQDGVWGVATWEE